MSLALQKADAFLEDFALQALWYVRQAGDEVARRFQQAVESRLRLLCEQPGLGRLRRFNHPKLQGLRSFAWFVGTPVPKSSDLLSGRRCNPSSRASDARSTGSAQASGRAITVLS